MKLFIDTENKVIKIEEKVNLGELIEKIKKLLPGEWKEYKLEANTQMYWANPIVIHEWPIYPSNPYWWNQPFCGITGGTITNTNGDSMTTDTVTIEPKTQYCIEC